MSIINSSHKTEANKFTSLHDNQAASAIYQTPIGMKQSLIEKPPRVMGFAVPSRAGPGPQMAMTKAIEVTNVSGRAVTMKTFN